MESAFDPAEVKARIEARNDLRARGRKGGLAKAANGHEPVLKRDVTKRVTVTAGWDPKDGRVPKLLDVLEEFTGDDGTVTQVTRADKIIEYVRRNVTLESAAAAAGVPRVTFRRWLAEAAEARQKIIARRSLPAGEVRKAMTLKGNKRLLVTRRERALVAFTDRLEQAMAEAEIALAEAVTRLAEGGWEQGFMTEKKERVKGKLTTVSKTVRSNKAAPNVAALQMVLSRRHPSGWAPAEPELAGSGTVRGGVSPAQLANVLEGLAEKITRRRNAMEAIEASSSEPSDIVDAVIVEDDAPDTAVD